MCSISIRSDNTFHWGINDNITKVLVYSTAIFLGFM